VRNVLILRDVILRDGPLDVRDGPLDVMG